MRLRRSWQDGCGGDSGCCASSVRRRRA
jgi:hypothetical protein